MEFASYEDAQRAIRELSEVPLLGRPVFIREVGTVRILRRKFYLAFPSRIARPKQDLVLELAPEVSAPLDNDK